MRCRILVPETASYPKIAQIAACGADVVTIRGSRQDVADAALAMSRDIFYASHNWQPFFAEGTKTLAYELWEQLGFRAPDSVVVPVGYGANVLGCDRGYSELLRNGEIARMPRLYGVQAANCAPYHAAFRAGVEHFVPAPVSPTVAEGIASSKPTRMREVLAPVRASGGEIVAVTEDEIVRALGGAGEEGALRRADLGRRRRGAVATHRPRRDQEGRNHRAGADRLRAQGVRDDRTTAQPEGPRVVNRNR